MRPGDLLPPERRLTADLAAVGRLVGPPREPASVRLERALGPELTQRLLASLVPTR
jgi:hypothetical protein